MKFNRALARLALLALAAASLLPLSAATFTWTDGAGDLKWDATSANWTAGAGNVPWTYTNDAVLGSTGAGAITVVGTQNISNITVSAAGSPWPAASSTCARPSPIFRSPTTSPSDRSSAAASANW